VDLFRFGSFSISKLAEEQFFVSAFATYSLAERCSSVISLTLLIHVSRTITSREAIFEFISISSTMDNISRACQRLQNHDASLTLLNLSCEDIGSQGIEKLSKSCSCHPSSLNDTKHPTHSALVALWVESNDIYPKGAVALSELISASPSLKYLYMAHNAINNSGAASISSVAMSQLEVCNIAENEIGQIGARAIAENLRDEKSTVKTLILESNHLRDQGTISIAEGLKENATLKLLDLRYNHIGKEGLTALRDILSKENKTLEYLFLEEEDDCECKRRQIPLQRNRKCPRLLEQSKQKCTCERCKIRGEIEYYLALNRAGRHSFGNVDIPASLWPRIMSHVSEDDPSLLYAMLKNRPDVMH
jgi:hypothetical protein